jgi:hypothetical protein
MEAHAPCTCIQIERGTAANVWLQALTAFVGAAALTAAAPLSAAALNVYTTLLSRTFGLAHSVAFRVNSRKFAIHTADHADRIARKALGDTGVAAVEKVVTGAVMAADTSLDKVGIKSSQDDSMQAEACVLLFNLCVGTPTACVPLSAHACSVRCKRSRHLHRGRLLRQA